MAKFIVKLNNKVIKKHGIVGSITIGRANSDLLLVNPVVSGSHARLDIENNRYILKDLKSTNGTFVNMGRISTQELHHGDVINIGKFELEFINLEEKEPPSDSFSDDAGGMTVMINAKEVMRTQKKTGTEKNAEKNAETNTETKRNAGKSPGASRLIRLPKSGKVSDSMVMYSLKKDMMLMGSAENADIRIKGFTIAGVAAVIRRGDDGHYIKYMGGMSKLKVNGEKVGGEVKLKSKDKIEIGAYLFEFSH